jgi:hypothetical protein
VSTDADAATGPPSLEIVVFVPQGDEPAARDPWIGPLVRASARGTRSQVRWSFLLFALCVYALVAFGARLGFALPAVLALAFAARFLASVLSWSRSSPRSRERLLATTFRKISLEDGDLLALKRHVYLRVSPDQWFKIRPASVYAPLLARKPYAWVLGPDSAGCAIVVLPGMVRPIVGRVAGAPPAGAAPVVPVAQRLEPPKDDEVLRASLTFFRRHRIANALLNVPLAGWLIAVYLPSLFGRYRTPDDVLGAATLYGLALALLILYAHGNALLRLRRMARAAHADAWTPLPIKFDRPLRRSVAFQNVTGEVSLPDGVTRAVEFRKISANLAAAMQASGLLWMAGELKRGRHPIGLPGYVGLALAKFGRARKPRP